MIMYINVDVDCIIDHIIDNFSLKVNAYDTCAVIKERLSLKLILPPINIHLMSNKNELK